MISSHETFGGTWPFAPRFFDGNGFRLHYVEEGSGQPIICLHGEPTWGYLYRRFIPPLSQSHRVIVPDHMGSGKSGTPRDRPYTLKTHVENLAGLIGALDLHDITFVIQDWGGPIAAAIPCAIPNASSACFCSTRSADMAVQSSASSRRGLSSSRSITRPGRCTRCWVTSTSMCSAS
jgi:cis-3-alkyl-4-acyloxetan-2-one decarboxylase